MKKELKGFVIGVLVTTMISSFAFAGSAVVKKKIDVLLNSKSVMVNGSVLKSDNIVYNGNTYVPVKALAEVLKKEYIEDKKTNSIDIRDKVVVEEGEYVVRDKSGNAIYSLKINKVAEMSERNKYSEKNPAQVIIVDYTYKNIADADEVYISESNFKVIDSKNKIGYGYPNSITNYPQKLPIGVSCDAQMIFGLDNRSDVVKLNFYDNMFGNMTKSFEFKIEGK